MGLLMLPFVKTKVGILFGLAVLAIGSGLNRAPTLGLLSILTPPNEQGAMQGVAQSAGSLARNLAPIFAASIYDYSHAAPYVACAAIAVIAGLVAWAKLYRAPVQAGA
jgi:MFS family permease